MKKLAMVLGCGLGLVIANTALAADTSSKPAEAATVKCAKDSVPNPCEFTQAVITNITDQLKQRAAEKKLDANFSSKLVSEVIEQHVDIEGMSKFAVGLLVWEAASESERGEFMGNFQLLIDGLYASAFQQYDNQPINVATRACRGDAYETAKIFKVPTNIGKSKSTPAINVDYKLVRTSCDVWKYYDFQVDGVSALLSFRSQFQAIMRDLKLEKGETMLGALNKVLEDHSKKNDVTDSTKMVAKDASATSVSKNANATGSSNGNS